MSTLSKSLLALFCCTAAAARAERVGLPPIALPDGERSLQEKLQTAVRDGAAGLSKVRSVEPLPQSACAPDEGRCLAAALRAAGLDAALTAQVEAAEFGYRIHLRKFANDGAASGELQREVRGGPLDLCAAVEGAACALLSGAECSGQLSMPDSAGPRGAHLFIDDRDRGAPSLPGMISLPVGRHAVRIGGREQRVVISRAAVAAWNQPDEPAKPFLAPAPLPEAREVSPARRATAARFLLASGLGLLAAGGGVGLFAQIESRKLDARYRDGPLAPADRAGYGQARAAGIAATALAASGLGALAVGGLVFALTPSGPAVGGRF